MLITLVRHGECLGQVDPDYWPYPDSALSPKGVVQAKATARHLAGENITHVLSSPLVRALETAVTLATACGVAHVNVSPDLREGFSGTYSGIPRAQLQARFPSATLEDSITEQGWSHGDRDLAALWQRCETLIEKLSKRFAHEDHVVLVTHGGLANYLLHVFLGIEIVKPRWFELANGSITRVRLVPDPTFERPNWPRYPPIPVEIHGVNEVGHLTGI